ncbi:pseudaminic acid cytidylyltransferase [Roseivirga sp.]|uniref:pseudaminic acid cytidylyltransferase n=1 Tax=Roseivirga sp. TaxID=1964215 RepID=UPI003B8D99C1
MSKLCIIPARGGSKRIPRKNIRDFAGKPIIAYSIETALASGLFDEVMVSTDDQEIADIAQAYGAKVPFLRSSENADDYATTFDVIQEVLATYQIMGQQFDYGCCIYPTAPLLNTDRLKEGYELLVERKFITVFPVVEFGYPIMRSLNLSVNDSVAMNWPEYRSSRSQDLQKAFHDAGQFYWFNSVGLLNEGELFNKNSGAIQLSQIEVQDIDNFVDWKLAELKKKLMDDEQSEI